MFRWKLRGEGLATTVCSWPEGFAFCFLENYRWPDRNSIYPCGYYWGQWLSRP